MNSYFECPMCGREYLIVDLAEVKCSENLVGAEVSERCPKCKVMLTKRVNKSLRELENMSEEEWIKF